MSGLERLPRLEKCCFLIDLKAGGIILGCLYFIYSICLILAGAIVLIGQAVTMKPGEVLILIVLIIIGAVELIRAWSLLAGTYQQGRSQLLITFIYMGVLVMILYGFQIIASLFVKPIDSLGYGFCLAITIYCWWVGNSLYQMLSNPSETVTA